MLSLNSKKILCISAHQDDFEIGCGALISRIGQYNEIFVLCLSSFRKAFNGEIQEIRNIKEQYLSLEILGIPRGNCMINDEIPGQLFPEYRQLILETLYETDIKLNPDLILVPSMNDIHQDHQTVALSALKAFKRKSVMGYLIINSSKGFNPNLYISVDEEDIRIKAKAIASFRSQLSSSITTADYFSYDVIKSIAVSYGIRIGTPFAEPYEIYQLKS